MQNSRFEKLLAFFTLVIISSSCLSAQSTFVKTGGTGSGSSWNDAAGDLRLVLAQAQNGDEIWVAEGTYTPTACTSCGVADRSFTFQVPQGVRLYGGFSGVETQLNQRMISTHVTTLSGDIDADGLSNNNSYHVVTFNNVDAQTRLDGFTLKDGFANGTNGKQNGGAISVDGSDSAISCRPVIANCTFINNEASNNGGAIYNKGYFGNSSPTIENCTFSLNSARQGGAIYNQGYRGESSPVIINCLFEDNSSTAGGAIYNSGVEGVSNVHFESCRFVRNISTGYGGAVYNFGKNQGGRCSPLFANCIFDDNEGTAAAGAIYSLGSTQGETLPEVVGCVFYDNYSNVGGAVYVNASDNGITHLRISNSIFTGSRANYDPILHFSGNSNPQISLDNVQLDATDCGSISGSAGGVLNCGVGLLFDPNAGFVDMTSGDFHLLSNAPGVDAGDGSYFTARNIQFDFAGSQRIQGSAADLGAYEFSTGDSDGDGILDSLDNCPFVVNPGQVDADGDGFGASCDCDDTNALVNPNATEICDGIDNDCNQQTDETGGSITYYADADGDTFGDPSVSTLACFAPAGYVLDNTDCDDADSTTYPGAPELCDGKDNNCDEVIDEGAVDTTPPVINCSPYSVSTTPGATITILPSDVYGSGSDDCSTVTLVSVSPNSFLIPGTYTVTLTAEDDAGNQATCSTDVTVTAQNFNGIYCTSTSAQPWQEWISNVAMADLNNASGKCAGTCGYSDFTSEVANVETGSTHDISLTPGLSWSGYQPDLYWRAWVDWNQDGDFVDAGELIASADNTFLTLVQQVVVPSNATLGTTRMRISMRKGSAPSPCIDFDKGEVEDYTIAVTTGGPSLTISGCPADQTIIVPPGDTGAIASWSTPGVTTTCPSGGESINQVGGPVSGSEFPLGTTQIVYAAADACGLVDTCRFEISVSAQPALLEVICPVDQTIQLLAGETESVVAWSPPTATTTCTGSASVSQIGGPSSGSIFQVGIGTITYQAVDNCGNTETCSFTVTVLPAQTNSGTYCVSESSQPWTEWIANIAFSNIDNASGKCDTRCGYGDFTNLIAALSAGTNQDITLTPGISWSGHQPDFHWNVWIDWNADGDFLDIGELVASEQPGNQAVTATISVPLTASGSTRMRISARAFQDAGPCDMFVRGEVEDYSVFISGGGSRTQPLQGIVTSIPSPLSLKLYPNPLRDQLTISASESLAEINVYSMTGQLVLSRKLQDQKIEQLDVSTILPGVYMARVLLASGEGLTQRIIVE